jgi:hypothetical protein
MHKFPSLKLFALKQKQYCQPYCQSPSHASTVISQFLIYLAKIPSHRMIFSTLERDVTEIMSTSWKAILLEKEVDEAAAVKQPQQDVIIHYSTEFHDRQARYTDIHMYTASFKP